MAPTNVLSLKQLSGAVEQAVKVAAERHKLQFEPGFSINGLINGRVVREAAALDLKAIRQASQDMAEQIAGTLGTTARVHLEPATLIAPKYILCGFMAPPAELVRFE